MKFSKHILFPSQCFTVADVPLWHSRKIRNKIWGRYTVQVNYPLHKFNQIDFNLVSSWLRPFLNVTCPRLRFSLTYPTHTTALNQHVEDAMALGPAHQLQVAQAEQEHPSLCSSVSA